MYQNRNQVPQDVLARKGIRFANFIIDYITIIIFSVVIGFILGIISELTGNYIILDTLESNIFIEYIFGYIIWLLYYIPFETIAKGRTLSKYITNTKVVTHQGLKPDLGDVFIRSLCRLIPFEQFSFLGTDGKGWHDSISKTYVVDVKKFENRKETESELDQIGKLQEEY